MQGCKWFELSTNDTIKLLTWEPPLIVQQSILTRKPIKGKPIPCTSSSWARWWWSWLPQDGPPFLIVLAWWRLVDCSLILTMGEPLFITSSQVHYHHNGRQASSLIAPPYSIMGEPLFELLHLNLHTSNLMTITTWCHPPWVVWDLPLDARPWKHT